MIRVFVADDHPVVREGLKQIIERYRDIQIVGEAASGQEVIDGVGPSQADLVVLDLNMPGRDGFEVLHFLRRNFPSLRVLILSIHPETQVALRVLRMGANGFINKETIPTELEKAIRTIHAGQEYLPAGVSQELLRALRQSASTTPHDNLSEREFQVFLMIASGLSVKDIADRLTLSVKTIRTFRRRVLEKLDVRNDVELSHYAVKHGLFASPLPK
ncbi:MAG: response regulator transcription factor [Ignavibacteriales bacterium]|nr:response regulator transcription factor [Ignavibacteriales bacterium]